ncbi:Ger(x)C family spore germination protein [Robertmurraya sp.]|jgi:spore germination protein KC|uniref:Ger(x)C family spore germination protein n=1 Tax=Robertmurraya sp. TaxID=2837525 RepID=UPI0037040099
MLRSWFICIIVCLLLTSCSGIKNIQDLTYIVAIGLDYNVETQEYTAYLQGLNFAGVAKQEGGKPTEPIPIFVASAKGETLNLAVRNLYKLAEPPLFFGHVKSLILTQAIVENKFNEVIEEIGRNRSLRPTLRIITTSEDMQDLLNVKALFNYPAVYTVLYKKNQYELSRDEIRPTMLMFFLREFHEPMGMSKIPTVSIDKETWKADEPYPILYFSGYSVFQHQKYIQTIPFKDAVYINWLREKHVALNQKVEEDGQLIAVLKLSTPKVQVMYEDNLSAPVFSLNISVEADLLEKLKEVPIKKVKEILQKDVESKVTELYVNGVEKRLDVLNLGERWYRANPKKYQEIKTSNRFYLDKNSLKDVKVSVKILHYNSYKYEKRVHEDME